MYSGIQICEPPRETEFGLKRLGVPKIGGKNLTKAKSGFE